MQVFFEFFSLFLCFYFTYEKSMIKTEYCSCRLSPRRDIGLFIYVFFNTHQPNLHNCLLREYFAEEMLVFHIKTAHRHIFAFFRITQRLYSDAVRRNDARKSDGLPVVFFFQHISVDPSGTHSGANNTLVFQFDIQRPRI